MGDNRSEALFKAVGQGDIESVRDLLGDLNPHGQNDTGIFNLLKMQNGDGRTVVHLAAGRSSPDMMQCLVEYLCKNFMYRLLTIQNPEMEENGDTLVHFAAVNSYPEIMTCFMSNVEFADMHKLFMVRNHNGYTPLHQVGRVEIIQCIVGFIENNQQLNDALMMQCPTGNTVAHIAVDHRHPNILVSIVSSMQMQPLMAYNFLKLQNDDGHTVVHCAARSGSVETLRCTLDCIIQGITPDDLLELLLIKCTIGQDTVAHLIASTDDIEMMRCLLDPLTPDQRLKILNSENVNKLTPWAVASQCENVDMMTCIEEYQN